MPGFFASAETPEIGLQYDSVEIGGTANSANFELQMNLVPLEIEGTSPDFRVQSVLNLEDCGNGSLDSGEVCDGADFGGQTCADYGFSQGNLQCGECSEILTTQCSMQNSGNEETPSNNDTPKNSTSSGVPKNSSTVPLRPVPAFPIPSALPEQTKDSAPDSPSIVQLPNSHESTGDNSFDAPRSPSEISPERPQDKFVDIPNSDQKQVLHPYVNLAPIDDSIFSRFFWFITGGIFLSGVSLFFIFPPNFLKIWRK